MSVAGRVGSQYHHGMFGALRLPCLLLLPVLCAACADAPVQALSDTRQTLLAAAAAGAADKAPQPYGEAVEGLHRAEDELRRGDYREATRQAEGARRAALQALRASDPAPPP